jgi:hypothetical protein
MKVGKTNSELWSVYIWSRKLSLLSEAGNWWIRMNASFCTRPSRPIPLYISNITDLLLGLFHLQGLAFPAVFNLRVPLRYSSEYCLVWDVTQFSLAKVEESAKQETSLPPLIDQYFTLKIEMVCSYRATQLCALESTILRNPFLSRLDVACSALQFGPIERHKNSSFAHTFQIL